VALNSIRDLRVKSAPTRVLAAQRGGIVLLGPLELF
jgi:hypothetical protein